MIETIDEFENRLRLLDPADVAFVIHADALIEDLSPSISDQVYGPIFLFFELHPHADCGAPGTLVHHVEDYYPNYVDALIDSVDRKNIVQWRPDDKSHSQFEHRCRIATTIV